MQLLCNKGVRIRPQKGRGLHEGGGVVLDLFGYRYATVGHPSSCGVLVIVKI